MFTAEKLGVRRKQPDESELSPSNFFCADTLVGLYPSICTMVLLSFILTICVHLTHALMTLPSVSLHIRLRPQAHVLCGECHWRTSH